jgi:Uncharacterized protein conserved in bacteria
MATTKRIQPCLWFDNQAEEAAKYYTASSRIRKSARSPATEKLDVRLTSGRPDRC